MDTYVCVNYKGTLVCLGMNLKKLHLSYLSIRLRGDWSMLVRHRTTAGWSHVGLYTWWRVSCFNFEDPFDAFNCRQIMGQGRLESRIERTVYQWFSKCGACSSSGAPWHYRWGERGNAVFFYFNTFIRNFTCYKVHRHKTKPNTFLCQCLRSGVSMLRCSCVTDEILGDSPHTTSVKCVFPAVALQNKSSTLSMNWEVPYRVCNRVYKYL